jgi:CheY-like chemotaxis protein
MMGGALSVESEMGKGSTFRIVFPEVTLTPEGDEAAASSADGLSDLEPATILYADDEPLNRELMRGYFEGTGHTLLLAENGKEAVGIAEASRPAAILMDIRMPVMGGIEASQIIKSKMDVPILAVTASSMKGERVMIEEVCDRHLDKPIAASILARALKDFLPVRPDGTGRRDAEQAAAETAGKKPDGAPRETPERWPDLLVRLRAMRDGEWPRLCDTPNMADVEAFASRLRGLAETHGAPPLLHYAGRLQAHAEEFDIEKLSAALRTLGGVIDSMQERAGGK